MGMRYHMSNNLLMVEAPATADGKKALEIIRKSRADMKGQRIMLQLCKPRAYDNEGKPIWWTIGEDDDGIDIKAKYESMEAKRLAVR